MVYGLIVDIGYTGYRGDGWLPGNVHLDAVIPVRPVSPFLRLLIKMLEYQVNTERCLWEQWYNRRVAVGYDRVLR